jgi:hypothetical protein
LGDLSITEALQWNLRLDAGGRLQILIAETNPTNCRPKQSLRLRTIPPNKAYIE